MVWYGGEEEVRGINNYFGEKFFVSLITHAVNGGFVVAVAKAEQLITVICNYIFTSGDHGVWKPVPFVPIGFLSILVDEGKQGSNEHWDNVC